MEQSRVRGGGRGGSLPICSSMSGRPLPLDPRSPGAFPLAPASACGSRALSSGCFHSLPRGLFSPSSTRSLREALVLQSHHLHKCRNESPPLLSSVTPHSSRQSTEGKVLTKFAQG